MFEALTERLQQVFRGLGRHGKLRPEDVDAALREIRLALLDADVHYQVVKELLERVRGRALSEEVSRALNPGQQVIRILHAELLSLLGEPGRLNLTGPAPRAILLVGLQGSGKTTSAAKLARWLRSRGERVAMIAADPYRPAAVEQLSTLAAEIDVPVFHSPGLSPVETCLAGMESAARGGASVVIIDSAGRSQLDGEMMAEVESIAERLQPVESLLVADAMTGQEAVNVARGFQGRVRLTGLILTKMDGDARGGAAISMRSVTGVPIKFLGTGEAREALETFEPDRLASRILGMGDVVGLIEKAQEAFDQNEVQTATARLMKGEFSLEDFAEQLAQMRKMGPLAKVLEMIPAGLAGAGRSLDGEAAEQQLRRTQAILSSMTRRERRAPEVLNGSRKRRIAAGSGTTVQEINQLLRQYQQMRKLYKQVGKRGLGSLGSRLR
jgi:signal recognition particle subunit SRP54